MAIVQIRLLLNYGRQGWTESVYYETDGDLPEVAEDVRVASIYYASARSYLFVLGVTFVKWLFNEVGSTYGDSGRESIGIHGGAPFQENSAEPITRAFRFEFTTPPQGVRQYTIRGLPDSEIKHLPAQNRFAPTQQYIQAVNEFGQAMVKNEVPAWLGNLNPNGNFGKLTYTSLGENDFPIINLTPGEDPTTTIVTVAGALAVAEGDQIQILNLDQRIYPCILDRFWVREPITANSFAISYILPSNAPLYRFQGRVRELAPVMLPFGACLVETYQVDASRDTGRAHEVPKGRRSRRRC